MMGKNFTIKFLAGLSALSLLLTSCGSTDATDGVSDIDGDLIPIEVGVIPAVDVSPVYLGIEEGIFEKHGLDVSATVAQGGAAIIPAVMSGDFDFGFSNVTSLIIASSTGLPIQIVAPGPQTTGVSGADYASIMVSSDSEYTEILDLEGKRVAVNTLNNITDTLMREAMYQAGGDPSSIEFVEVPYPDMPSLLENGNVDAIFVAEPFQTIASGNGAKEIFSPFVEPVEGLMISTYFTNDEKTESSPEVVEKFAAAMREAQALADESPEAAKDVLDEYLELEPAVVDELVMPSFPQEVNRESTQKLIDLAVKYEIIGTSVDLDDLMFE